MEKISREQLEQELSQLDLYQLYELYRTLRYGDEDEKQAEELIESLNKLAEEEGVDVEALWNAYNTLYGPVVTKLAGDEFEERLGELVDSADISPEEVALIFAAGIEALAEANGLLED